MLGVGIGLPGGGDGPTTPCCCCGFWCKEGKGREDDDDYGVDGVCLSYVHRAMTVRWPCCPCLVPLASSQALWMCARMHKGHGDIF
jgi:hypothetical protein